MVVGIGLSQCGPPAVALTTRKKHILGKVPSVYGHTESYWVRERNRRATAKKRTKKNAS